jgi:hypothetical protein
MPLEFYEWDIVVTANGISNYTPPFVHVVAFGGAYLGRPDSSGWPSQDTYITAEVQDHGTEFSIPESVPAGLVRALIEACLPTVTSRDLNYVIGTVGLKAAQTASPSEVSPFLLTASGWTAAGRFARLEDRAECWVFPAGCDPVRLTSYALTELGVRYPDRFPPSEPWTQNPRWMTFAELREQREASRLQEERALANARLDQLERESQGRLNDATQSADSGERRLLTAQGADLVAAASQALTELGFCVQNMDDIWPSGDHREDLRLTSPGHPDWEAIVEVRGYARGAQMNDLMRLARFARRFQEEVGKWPPATWYVVNQFSNGDPSERDQALASNPSELEEFKLNDGLVLDTRELFKLLMRVRAGEVLPTEAVSQLIEARGRWPE